MSTTATRLALALLAVLSIGAGRPDGNGADARAIHGVMNDFDAAMTARSVDGVMATLVESDDLTLFLPTPYVPMRVDGVATARKAIEIFFQNIPKQAAFLVTHHQPVVHVQGDTAVAYSFHNFYLNAGALPATLLCRTTTVLEKQGGRWRIVHLHSGALPEVGDYIPK